MADAAGGNLLFIEAFRLIQSEDVEGGIRLVRQVIAERALPEPEAALLLNNLGASAVALGTLPTAVRLLTEATEMKRRLGDPHSLGLTLANLGFVKIDLAEWIQRAELVIEGARLIAGSPFPETNAQLSNNFLAVSLHKAPDAERQRMKQMWFDAGLGNLSWPPTSIRMGRLMPPDE